jgi:glycosyltransferase involved in cell wall biosynthesis
VRIGIDLSGLMREGTGAETYTRHLLAALVAQATPGTEFVGFVNCFSGTPRLFLPDGLSMVNPRWPWRILRPFLDRGLWSIDRFTGPVDVFHGTDWTCPPLRRGALVATVFDLAFERYPELYPAGLVAIHRRQLDQVAQRARGVIAISASTERDLQRRWGARGPKVRVIHPAADPVFAESRDPSAEAELRARLGLPERYLLYLGTQAPRKNLPRLVRAYARARRGGLRLPLVLAGSGGVVGGALLHGASGWDGPRIREAIASSGYSDHVRVAGHLRREDAAHLMHGALVFVFPSLYEGFGLPVLEAMSAGVPVIASRASSLPEVGGDAVRYVDPESEESMAAAMVELDGDAALRDDLSRRGRARSSGFTWARAAKETLAFYRELSGVE